MSPRLPRLMTFSSRIICIVFSPYRPGQSVLVQVGVRHQREETRALDGRIELTLVMRLGASQTSRRDLAVVADEVLQGVQILVVDLIHASHGEAAEALALEQRVLLLEALLVFVVTFDECHDSILYECFTSSDVKDESLAVAVPAGHEALAIEQRSERQSLQ